MKLAIGIGFALGFLCAVGVIVYLEYVFVPTPVSFGIEYPVTVPFGSDFTVRLMVPEHSCEEVEVRGVSLSAGLHDGLEVVQTRPPYVSSYSLVDGPLLLGFDDSPSSTGSVSIEVTMKARRAGHFVGELRPQLWPPDVSPAGELVDLVVLPE